MEERIEMNTEELDDGSIVVNFDKVDTNDDVIASNGYVHVCQENNRFVVIVFDAEGNVLSETVSPFVFESLV
jgi:hypothetical protein